MRVSTDYQFVFLNNVKCASTSVNKVITRYCDFTPNDPEITRHMTARQLLTVAESKEWDLSEFFVFTTIRNPWARLVSQWFHSKRIEHSIFRDAAHAADDIGDFLEANVVRNAYQDRHTYGAFCNDGSGNTVVDLAIRVEDLDRGLASVLRILGLPVPETVPNANPSSHKPYRQYYNARSRRLLEELMWEDIEAGRYEF